MFLLKMAFQIHFVGETIAPAILKKLMRHGDPKKDISQHSPMCHFQETPPRAFSITVTWLGLLSFMSSSHGFCYLPPLISTWRYVLVKCPTLLMEDILHNLECILPFYQGYDLILEASILGLLLFECRSTNLLVLRWHQQMMFQETIYFVYKLAHLGFRREAAKIAKKPATTHA